MARSDLTAIAQVCHEANRAYCATLGDGSQPAWGDAPDWQRESAIAGVQAIADGRVTRPEQSHESWLEQKREDGWRWGPVKDPDKKEHPCFMAYELLPAEQRMKDHLFFAIATTLLLEEPT